MKQKARKEKEVRVRVVYHPGKLEADGFEND
jgi:hypothetical protein